MKGVVLLITCAVFALATSSYIPKELFVEKDLRIANGKPIELGQFPWHVSVLPVMDGGASYRCGGALIHPKFVLTAAHCIPDEDATVNHIQLRLGSTDFYENGTLVVVNQYIKHEKYAKKEHLNDFALIYIPDPVEETKYIKTIQLPNPGEVIGVGEKLTVSGSGLTETGMHSEIKYLDVYTITQKECKEDFPSEVKKQHLCVLGGSDVETICTGDSGGPLVKYTDKGPVHVGVVSFGYGGGCGKRYPQVFGRTEMFVNWINKTMKKFLLSKQ